jgi:hypothetical protein
MQGVVGWGGRLGTCKMLAGGSALDVPAIGVVRAQTMQQRLLTGLGTGWGCRRVVVRARTVHQANNGTILVTLVRCSFADLCCVRLGMTC